MLVTKNENNGILNGKYMELVNKIKLEFTDIVLPSMGMINDE